MEKDRGGERGRMREAATVKETDRNIDKKRKRGGVEKERQRPRQR